MSNENLPAPEAIAIVGLAGRFPRARNVDEFWRNLRQGVEGVSFFDDQQVEWLPLEHPPVLSDPRYIKARAVLDKPEWFDAAFFGLNPREGRARRRVVLGLLRGRQEAQSQGRVPSSEPAPGSASRACAGARRAVRCDGSDDEPGARRGGRAALCVHGA